MTKKALLFILLLGVFSPLSLAHAKTSFDEGTGVLTISESVDKESLQAYSDNTAVKEVVALKDTKLPADSSELFSGFKAEKINLSLADTSGVTDMSYMFSDCDVLKELNLKNIDTSSVTDMQYMFNSCYELKSLDLSYFNTKKVTNMKYMFCDMQSLVSADLQKFDTASVTDMTSMFRGCSSLKDLDVTSFNTGKVETMEMMFSRCSSLENIDLSSFSTVNTEDISSMFEGCTKLKSLDIAHFDTSKVIYMSSVFSECSSLKELDLTNFNRSNATYKSYTFSDCDSLEKITIGNDFGSITTSDYLLNGYGWINVNDAFTTVSGTQMYARITNEGVNTYQRNKTPVGKTGDCIWTFDPNTGVLTINGTGSIPDFESYLRPDWYKYKTDITKVVIEKGVTSIGAYAFTDLSALKYVGISNTVETIAGSAFQNSKPLYMTIPKNTQLAPKSIGYNTSETDKYTDFIICGYKGSPAETYASENSFTFIPIGDLNNDNAVNSVDAAMLLKYITGRSTLNATQLIAANLTQKTGEDPDLRDVIAILS